MKIVCISDTHNMLDQVNVPDGDVLIHAGDATVRGTMPELVKFNQDLRKLPHPVKIFVAGNHDILLEKDRTFAKSFLQDVVYLEDSYYEYGGIVFYGAPWQPEFRSGWAFNLPRGEALKKRWQLIPQATDILITHSPANGILDVNPRGEHSGCEELRQELLRLRMKFHVFGHIHTGYGRQDMGYYEAINAATCDEGYNPVNPPIVIEV